MADAPAMEMRGLSKTYASGVRALVDVDLRVERGEVFGYLGPNGAGKSTTIRLLLDLIRPTAGRADVLGHDTRARSVEARRRVGYVPGDLRLADRLTGDEQLDSLARLRGGVDLGLRAELVERFECVLDRPIKELSRGNRQKLGVVQAFMHRPEVLILDEPTAGLDPLNQEEFRKLARETAADGRTVFLSSHSLEEVQRIADRVGIIRTGRLIDVDSVASLRERSLRRIAIRFAEPADPSAFAGLDGVRVQSAEGTTVVLSAPETAMDGVIREAARHRIADFVSEPADLEEIFLELYRENDGRG
ncbi:MAG TPA: ABC transporter ATP-binding protein [Gaiellaceae bacterium]|nr:ABC transporter ATP-binding protein [Gaiellaceae bacterium]